MVSGTEQDMLTDGIEVFNRIKSSTICGGVSQGTCPRVHQGLNTATTTATKYMLEKNSMPLLLFLFPAANKVEGGGAGAASC